MDEDEELLKKVLSKKSPEEIIKANIKKTKIALTVIAFLNVLALLLFFPYEAITGYAVVNFEPMKTYQAVYLATSFIAVSVLIMLQLRKLTRMAAKYY